MAEPSSQPHVTAIGATNIAWDDVAVEGNAPDLRNEKSPAELILAQEKIFGARKHSKPSLSCCRAELRIAEARDDPDALLQCGRASSIQIAAIEARGSCEADEG